MALLKHLAKSIAALFCMWCIVSLPKGVYKFVSGEHEIGIGLALGTVALNVLLIIATWPFLRYFWNHEFKQKKRENTSEEKPITKKDIKLLMSSVKRGERTFWTKDHYEKMTPLVEIPEYSDQELYEELVKLNAEKRSDVKEWFIKEYSQYVLVASIVAMGVFFWIFPWILEGIEPAVVEMFNSLRGYMIFGILGVVLVLPMTMCHIPHWYRKTDIDEAEFSLRLKLTKPQLDNSSDEKVNQIFAYCNSARRKPLKF